MGKGAAHDMMTTAGGGIQKEYLQGLDNLRTMIHGAECDIDRLKREFYNCEENSEDLYEKYMKTCNEKLLYCNAKLRRKDVKLEVIDSEIRLVALLNQIRDINLDSNVVKPEVISFLTEFWENLKNTLEGTKGLIHRFQSNILKRLKSMCVSYQQYMQDGLTLDLTKRYSEHVKNYQADIKEMLRKADLLIKSFNNKIKQENFTKSSFTDRMLITCDQKAFPILRLIPDLTEKLVHLCSVARTWIDKDENYIHDMSNYIRSKRKETRKKEEDLRTHIEKKTKMSESVQEALEQFKSKKKKVPTATLR